MNPYKAPAGNELDIQLAAYFFKNESVQPYSTDPKHASRLKKAIEAKYDQDVVVGLTRTRTPFHFARLDEDPSTSVETLAESYALALARLALVLALRRNSPIVSVPLAA
jgi:hypothetical protein